MAICLSESQHRFLDEMMKKHNGAALLDTASACVRLPDGSRFVPHTGVLFPPPTDAIQSAMLRRKYWAMKTDRTLNDLDSVSRAMRGEAMGYQFPLARYPGDAPKTLEGCHARLKAELRNDREMLEAVSAELNRLAADASPYR